jgi:aspartyl-tRNA(Asn)/glutamyl-tRNA(Gln) amidotransferase subunit A
MSPFIPGPRLHIEARPGGPLAGLTFAAKDLFDVAGHVTGGGNPDWARQNPVPTRHAWAVQALLDAGCTLVGKTVTDEVSLGILGENAFEGTPENPAAPGHVPGGSSSGSASAVAAGVCDTALGTDTGGSVRHPASHCGIVGMKPTYGLVSRRGVFPLAFTLDHVGPMTRDVASNAMLLNAIAGHDAADPGSAAVRAENYARALKKGLRGLTIGYVRHFHETDQPATAEVAAAIDAAARVMSRHGAKLKTVTLPALGDFAGVNRAILMSEAAAIHGRWLREAPDGYSNLTRKRLAPGLFVRAEDYVNAQRRRRELVAAVEATLADCDLLLTASSMDPACRIDDPEAVEITYPRQARTPFNVTGHPALTLMCGLSQAEGLPLSLQLVGRFFGEATIYRAAAAYEAAAPWKDRRPAL